jgi:aminopeptidase N
MTKGPLPLRSRRRNCQPSVYFAVAAMLCMLLAASSLLADEPYARSRDYDLQHSRIALRFDLDQKKVIGNVTHTLALLRDSTKIVFDSSGLNIRGVTVNKASAKFEAKDDKLIVFLSAPARAGEKFDVEIRYDGKPSKGLYFILPDKDYTDRPRQIWTQGESEDTHYYIPTYDYPNDRLTTETILTVPSSWITVANGKLISVSDSGQGMKTWTWKESLPSSTYLITVVAGEFEEAKDSWRGMPVTYYAPKGRGNRLALNYGRTPAMIELFSRKLGVAYPWEKYAQSMVDDFVAGGMENSSATTNTSSSLHHPKLASEYFTGEDNLISHELGHQWFGDFVTCKDWGDVWLNEGFATFMESVWTEAHYGKDQADYERWENARGWFEQARLYAKPMVRHDFHDSAEFDGNAYTKGGWVLDMLRHQLGEEEFYKGLKHYLEANRGKNVVSADLSKAMEEATHTNVDQFFTQWVYGAGAPQFDLSYKHDEAKHQIALTVKQAQKIEGRVGIFHIPVDVEITTASGSKLYSIATSKETEIFTFPTDYAPLMVLFDKGGHVLKSAEFHKDKKEWFYQLKHATEVADRADAVSALSKMKDNEEVVAALGEALRSDKAWGIRANAADALGELDGAAASKQLLDALNAAKEPWIRSRIVAALGNFKNDTASAAKLDSIARDDGSYRARAAALQALGRLKATNAFATLEAAVIADSPDGMLRNAALRAMGSLGDDKAVPLLLQWSSPGKQIDTRNAAIASLARLKKDDHDLTKQIASYLTESHFTVRMASILALGSRGDDTAIPALEDLLKRDDLSIEMVPMIRGQIERLKKPGGAKGGAHEEMNEESDDESETTVPAPVDETAITKRLDKLERLVQEMNERIKSIETRLPPPKQ